MVIEEIIPMLPKSEGKIKNAYENCKPRFVAVNNKEFSAHLEKAKSDLANVESDFSKGSWDWAIIKSYYAIHHAINALLIKEKGFYSKDHICAILAVRSLNILPWELYSKVRQINAKFADFTGFDVTYTLRKISQYDVRKWRQLTKKDAESIYLLAKEVVSFAEKRCFA
ncbi:MAG: HEPN domain-containing protein [Nanoarchaeota archaeon]|nr:HEPN domain-containing protein [Nanoarchaeota archaeon]